MNIKFMHLLCSGVLKSLSSINKQTIFGFDFHKSDKYFTCGRDYQGYLLIKLPVNTFLSRGYLGKNKIPLWDFV